jgi:hypothetical protein
MSDGLRKKIIFATLPLAIVWAVLNFPSDKSAAPVDSPQNARLQTIAPIVAPPTPDARLINIEAKQAEPWGEDPFRSSLGGEASAPGGSTQLAWVLGGIIYSHQAPVAFINKRMVRVGDRVGDATIVSIEKKAVVLEYQGRQIKLELSKG